jgi:hypothetical protein
MESLLSNEFVVLALDALLHLASALVLGILVIIACKLLSRGFVDAKLITGLMIAGLLIAMRSFLLNNVHHVLADFDAIIIMLAIGVVLLLTCLILVYKLIAIPVIGTIFSSLAIVAAQLALAHYTPVLSLKLMPEGQRFAEYAGVSNEKTKQLMQQAKNFEGDSRSNIAKILKEALASLAFLSSEKEQEILSKDMASGVRFIQERKAFMDSMSEEELAEYRASMSSFMQEQGVDLQNRYSLENLKNATPQDLQNLANFMKDMDRVYGLADDLPEGMGEEEDLPPSLDSIKQIARNLKGIKIGGKDSEQFTDLLKDIIGDEDFNTEMIKVRSQIDDLKANAGDIMETFAGADLAGLVVAKETGDYATDTDLELGGSVAPEANTSDYFPESELSNSLTESYVLRVPKSPDERSRWSTVANKIEIGAWLEGTGGANKGTIFIDGIAYRSGATIKREHQDEQYLFRFEGIEQGQVIMKSLKRESRRATKPSD